MIITNSTKYNYKFNPMHSHFRLFKENKRTKLYHPSGNPRPDIVLRYILTENRWSPSPHSAAEHGRRRHCRSRRERRIAKRRSSILCRFFSVISTADRRLAEPSCAGVVGASTRQNTLQSNFRVDLRRRAVLSRVLLLPRYRREYLVPVFFAVYNS